jgi:hypothetical protein
MPLLLLWLLIVLPIYHARTVFTVTNATFACLVLLVFAFALAVVRVVCGASVLDWLWGKVPELLWMRTGDVLMAKGQKVGAVCSMIQIDQLFLQPLLIFID